MIIIMIKMSKNVRKTGSENRCFLLFVRDLWNRYTRFQANLVCLDHFSPKNRFWAFCPARGSFWVFQFFRFFLKFNFLRETLSISLLWKITFLQMQPNNIFIRSAPPVHDSAPAAPNRCFSSPPRIHFAKTKLS